MADEPPDLIFDMLRAIRGENAKTHQVLAEVLLRLTRLEGSVAGQRREQETDAEAIAHLQAQFDRANERIDRINRRLDIVD